MLGIAGRRGRESYIRPRGITYFCKTCTDGHLQYFRLSLEERCCRMSVPRVHVFHAQREGGVDLEISGVRRTLQQGF